MLTPLDIENKRFSKTIKGYNVEEVEDNIEILDSIMKKRGIHRDDYDKCYELLMNEFRNAKLGRITLDII